MSVAIRYGRSEMSLRVEPVRLVGQRRRAEPIPAADPAALVRTALESPLDFPALRLAVTPDDLVAVVVDHHLPDVERLIIAILDHLESAGVNRSNVSIIYDGGDELSPDIRGVSMVRHEPDNQKNLAYVATTAAGRRVYLNRALVEADQVVVLAEVRHDPRGGVTGGPAAMFPTLADAATQASLAKDSTAKRSDEAAEVGWLLGLSFFVHVIASAGEGIARVIGGPAESHRGARQAVRDLWVAEIDRPADLVIASLTGEAARFTTGELAAALTHASKALQPGGTLVVLTEACPELGEAFATMRQADSPEEARGRLNDDYADRWAAQLWLRAVQRHRVLLMSRWPDEVIEDLFATPLQNAGQVQRLIDSNGDVLLLPDAHRTFPACRGE